MNNQNKLDASDELENYLADNDITNYIFLHFNDSSNNNLDLEIHNNKIKKMIEAGSDINHKNSLILRLVINERIFPAFKILINNGAKLLPEKNDYSDDLKFCIKCGHLDFVQFLVIDKNADPSIIIDYLNKKHKFNHDNAEEIKTWAITYKTIKNKQTLEKKLSNSTNTNQKIKKIKI